MIPDILKWTVILSAMLNFGYMTFDGFRAVTIGDYIRPKSGEYAGQLGPWSIVVKSLGINPESTLMKTLFIVWGLTGLYFTVFFGLDYDWAWKGLLIFNFLSLWYLVPGTLLSLVQIILLGMIRLLN